MVSPNDKPKEPDGYYSSDYSYVAERFLFTGVVGYNMGDHAESGEDKNVDFGVSKESEEVLVKDGVSPSGRVKEGGVKVSVCKEHGNAGS